MKKLTAILLYVLIPMVGYSQLSVGLSGGYVNNTLDAESGYYYNREYLSESGFSVAIPIQYSFNDWFALRSEVGYTTKNYSYQREVPYFMVTEREHYRNGYLQLPVMANLSFGTERIRGFINLGAYVGAWINSFTKGELMEFSDEGDMFYVEQSYEFNSERDNRFDGGVVAGLGAQYNLNPTISIFAEGRLVYGLSDTQKSYMIDQYHRYNTTMIVQLGVMYNFSLK